MYVTRLHAPRSTQTYITSAASSVRPWNAIYTSFDSTSSRCARLLHNIDLFVSRLRPSIDARRLIKIINSCHTFKLNLTLLCDIDS